MKRLSILPGALLGLALLVTGCETDEMASRIQEKSAVYASLKPWQKKYVDAGVVAIGFTPDMVFMAIGRPSKVEPQESPEGTVEVWTYKNYYPSVGAANMRLTQNGESLNNPGRLEKVGNTLQPRGMGRGGLGPSIATTGPIQGGSGEPADIQSYTLVATFKHGKVKHLKLDSN